MMPQARKGDLTSGHPGYTPIALSVGSLNVKINSLEQVNTQHIQTDPHPPLPLVSPESPFNVQVGSSTVFINGAPQVRLGDMSTCGAFIVQGSPNVLIG